MRKTERRLLDAAWEALAGAPESLTPTRITQARESLALLRAADEAKRDRIRTRALAPHFAFDYATGRWVGITDDLLDRWAEAFPSVDFDVELGRAAAWLIGPPMRRKKAFLRFVWQWFGRREPTDAVRVARERAGLQPREPVPGRFQLTEEA